MKTPAVTPMTGISNPGQSRQGVLGPLYVVLTLLSLMLFHYANVLAQPQPGAEAKEHYEKAVTLDTKVRDIERRLWEGKETTEEKKALKEERHKLIDSALVEYTQALSQADLDKDLQMSAFTGRGRLYMRRHDYARAINDFSEALTLRPADAGLLHLRAECYAMRGDYKQALLDYDRVVDLQAYTPGIYYDRGTTRFKAGQYAGAIQDLTEFLKVQSSREVYELRGDAAVHVANYDLALPDYGHALALTRKTKLEILGKAAPTAEDPDEILIPVKMAKVYEKIGNPKKAVDIYEDLIRRFPADFEAYREAARVYLTTPSMKDPKKALHYADQAVALSYERDVDALAILARALSLDGAIKQAVAAQEKAVQLDPENEELQKSLLEYRKVYKTK